jgi:hypothetical protein
MDAEQSPQAVEFLISDPTELNDMPQQDVPLPAVVTEVITSSNAVFTAGELIDTPDMALPAFSRMDV